MTPAVAVTLKHWRKSVRSGDFPPALRFIKGTLLELTYQMSVAGLLCKSRDYLAMRTGLPLRSMDYHLNRAVETGWLIHVVHGGHGRKAVYQASVPQSCAQRMARND